MNENHPPGPDGEQPEPAQPPSPSEPREDVFPAEPGEPHEELPGGATGSATSQHPLPTIDPPAPPPDGSGGSPRRSRLPFVLGGVSGAVALALLGAGISWYVVSGPSPDDSARDYLDAWSAQEYGTMAGLSAGTDEDEITEIYGGVADNLGVEQVETELGGVEENDDTATAPFEATLTLANAEAWSYSGELELNRSGDAWEVVAGPSSLHPDLAEGKTLARATEWGERGSILAADGSRLDTEEASGSVRMLTGRVESASEEDLENLGPAYGPGDPVGVGGIQQAYEERLAGTAATSIRVVDAGEEDAAEDAPNVATLEGEDGADVTTSIDPDVQRAAADAITGQSNPTSLVAIRPSSGEILAAANVPGGYNRAFNGTYAPGSSFKIVSYQALLEAGLAADGTMNCPKTANVGGWEFTNAHDDAFGSQSVTEAFATSCNTALVQEVAQRLDADTFTTAAERFGMNADLNVGIPTQKPSYPSPENATMLAAQSIGQGQVSTSPLHMATVPAAVSDGSWRSPVLVTEPEVDDQPEPAQLQHAQELRPMMREVVTNGTADSAGFTGEVYGKTGSAEFGTAEGDEELETHAWFVGYRDDVAFAVVVEGGGGGGSVAAPVARDFLGGI
ncbi:penicillin-binding protein [Haloactinospora alba]|uniref:Penicillin-binding protein n=1 Tax=Haloactinospora alba TaxID=405555 RepID=A0A543NI69_9ACTN|nr:penicillin-binding transpeptidase domain-containing protein [Haloactinospora alba]TQN31535.1 penicillin-binding protein [Haloactinospora alba]